MRTSLIASLALALALSAWSCGGDGGSDFDKCGNGALDSGEECDDGNLTDTDACLSTCQANVCGDGFVDRAHEECDGVNASCADLGLGQGTANCLASCTYDKSACRSGGNPTPILTPTPLASDGVTPTSDLGTSTPTPQPTAGGSVCSGTEQIIVTLSLDADYTAARLDLEYPASANIPGSGTDQSVRDRIELAGSGLEVKNDFDANADLADDTATAGFVATDVQAAGLFATVTFDCVGGQPQPSASDFTCNVVSASLQGAAITPNCTVSIQ